MNVRTNGFLDKLFLFKPLFVYGISLTTIIISDIMMLLYGSDYCFHGRQIHAFHVIWISSFFMYFYRFYRMEENNISRFLLAFCFIFFIWFIHDSFACLSCFTQGGLKFNEAFMPMNTLQTFMLYERNIIYITCSLFILTKIFKAFNASRWFIFWLVIQVVYWLMLSIFYGDITFFDPITIIIDALPYIRIMKRRKT